MSDTLLYAATAAVPAVALAGLAFHVWHRYHPQDMTVTEWREKMRKLEPLKAPKFRNKHMATGAPGISYPEPKTKIAVVKRKASK